MSKKLEDLLKKREQINAQIQKARARHNAQERKEVKTAPKGYGGILPPYK